MSAKSRQITIDGPLAYIPLTKGRVAVIDAADVHLVAGSSWYANESSRTTYAQRKLRGQGNGGSRVERLHRVILGSPNGLEVDHIDGDGLNNTRANLRLATRSENNRNKRVRSDNTSGFKGVSFNKKLSKWFAQIFVDKKKIYLGLFDAPEEAHKAYCFASKQHHGDFGRLA